MGKQSTPRVPIQTPMYDKYGNLTRTWIIFFERLGTKEEVEEGEPVEVVETFQRTLLLKDCIPGDDIADHVTVNANGTAVRVVGVLREGISADLVVKININGDELITCTMPWIGGVDNPVEFTEFVEGMEELEDGDVLSFDIVSSDNRQNKHGVAAFTLEWR